LTTTTDRINPFSDALLHRCAYGIYDTILYHTIVKAFARIPTNDTFLARRISGPGLASEYFYQVSSPEVLAALESLIEQNQLKAYDLYVKRILMKPIVEYQFVEMIKKKKKNEFIFLGDFLIQPFDHFPHQCNQEITI
jgi:hypothetical protein